MNPEFLGSIMERVVDLSWEFCMILFADFVFEEANNIEDQNANMIKHSEAMLAFQLSNIPIQNFEKLSDESIFLKYKSLFMCRDDDNTSLYIDTKTYIDANLFFYIDWNKDFPPDFETKELWAKSKSEYKTELDKISIMDLYRHQKMKWYYLQKYCT